MLPFHTFILKNDGTIWGCGENDYGNLGLGDATPRTVFTKVNTNIENIKSISYGRSHTAILENDNTVWMCGSNYHGPTKPKYHMGVSNCPEKALPLVKILTKAAK